MTFRSQEMAHFQLVVPRQGGWEAVNQLGQIQLAHIVDCGDPSNRPFFPQLKRCEEALQKIQFIKEAILQAKLQVQEFDQTQPLFVQKLHQIWKQSARKYGVQQLRLLDRYQAEVLQQWQRFQEIKTRIEKLKQGNKIILQQIACYQTAKSIFGQDVVKRNSQEYFKNNNAGDFNQRQISGVSFLVGVVPADVQIRLNRMIYRVSRGYACVKTQRNFKFPGLRHFQEVVTLVIYPSSDTTVLEKKLKRVMETFCSNNFFLSQIQMNASAEIDRLSKEYYEVENLMQLNCKQMQDFLHRVRKIQFIQNWRTYLWKERQLYTVLDKMEVNREFFRVEVYVPKEYAVKLSINLSRMSPQPSLTQMSLINPPTAFRVTEYTGVAQEITDTYGVPRYQQINPTMFTVVTFPFFFGVMFGDIAHGAVLFAFGLYLIFFEETVKRSSLKVLAPMKYIVTMMGFFAFYCGWIYNDFIGMNINVFGSCYHPPPKVDQSEEVKLISKIFYPDRDCIYPFGLDPIWGRSSNELVYVNALKMKISVIIAVIHMTLGILLKAANALYFKRTIQFVFEFIPQIIFMVGLFGYMDFLIVLKWLTEWKEGSNPERWAPSIISTMMNIGLKLGQTSIYPDGNSNMWGQHGNSSQDTIQMVILIVAFICVPVMLFPKPCIQINQAKALRKQHPLHEDAMSEDIELQRQLNPSHQSSVPSQHQQHDASQIFVHQLIETIEFVLGAISNTASYLRLWALSLAHSQLAKVFFQKTLQMGYGPQTLFAVPIMFIGFYALAWITFGILMCMDSMECFLHSLRLHWVEFQNKFYKGDGYKYQPFSFKSYILQQKTSSAL